MEVGCCRAGNRKCHPLYIRIGDEFTVLPYDEEHLTRLF